MAQSTADRDARLRREADAHGRAMTRVLADPETSLAETQGVRAYRARVDELVRADLGYVPRKLTFRERMTDPGGLELFRPTPAGIAEWVRTTRPAPDADAVAAYVARLREAGTLTDRDVAEVERLLPEVGPIG